MTSPSARAHWSGKLAFVLAATGSAVGLGNIWKFPYMAGVNGGGAFVLVYLVCIAAVGLPIMIGEIYIGRESQRNTVGAFEVLHREKTPWRFAGLLGLLSAFLILSFYSVVGGWVLAFEWKALLGEFAKQDEETISGYLLGLFRNPQEMILWHTAFMGLTVGIVAMGISKGIERASKILMPALFVLLMILLFWTMGMSGFGQSVEFLFYPHWEKLSWSAVLEAVGHSFFTLSLGMGAMITYGSYMARSESIIKTGALVALIDTIVALTAGLVIFAVVYTFGQQPDAGPKLMFVNLPLLFKQMTGGYFVAVAFFLLVFFAALTSGISLLEVVVAYWDETRGWNRRLTAGVAGSVIYLLGIGCALSFNVLEDFKILGFNLFDLFDVSTSKIFLPFGGMVISLFYGWILGPKAVQATFDRPVAKVVWQGLMWCARVIAPVAVAVMLVMGLRDL